MPNLKSWQKTVSEVLMVHILAVVVSARGRRCCTCEAPPPPPPMLVLKLMLIQISSSVNRVRSATHQPDDAMTADVAPCAGQLQQP